MTYKRQIDTIRDEFLGTLHSPRMLVDVCCVSVAVLGLVGCFSDSRIGKNLGLSALLAGIGSLWANVAVVRLYSHVGANYIQTQVDRIENDVVLFQKESEKHQHHLHQTQNQLEALSVELEQVRQALIDSQQSLDSAQLGQVAALTDRDKALDRASAVDAKFKRYQQQLVDSLNAVDRHARSLISDAVTDQCDRLISAINARQKNAPTLAKIRQEVAALRSHYLSILKSAIAPRSHLGDWFGIYLELLSQAVEEISALRVKFRNALNVAEVKGYMQQVEVLGSQLVDVVPRSQHEAILSEFKIKQSEAFGAVLEKTEELEHELNGDIDQYVSKLLKQLETAQHQIAQLQQQFKEASQPYGFSGASRDDLRMANAIISYFAQHGLILDRAYSDYKKWEATVFFHCDRNRRQVLPSELNEHSDRLQPLLNCLNVPCFDWDSSQGLVRVRLQLSAKPKADTDEINRLWKRADQFPGIAARWERVRVTGGSESGKSPTAENLAVCILLNKPGRVALSNPMHDSQKNYWSIPVGYRSHEQQVEALKELSDLVLSRANGESPRDEFRLYIFDEIDSTMERFKQCPGLVKNIIKQASHQNLGAIFIGQNANASNYKGMDRSDWNNAVNLHIGANCYDAITNSNSLTSQEQSELKTRADKLTEFCQQKNQELGLSRTDPNAFRFALVIEPNTRPYFIELPNFGRYTYGILLDSKQSKTIQTEQPDRPPNPESVRHSSIPGNSLESALSGVCPDCGMSSSDRKGKPQNGRQRYFCSNPKCSRQTFTVEVTNELIKT